MEVVSQSILKKVYKKRDEWSHKGQFGRLLCITGSYRLTGSPIFVGLSAYRAGCDLVFLVGPKRAMDVAAFYAPELMTEPLDGNVLEEKHVPQILSLVKSTNASAIVIGNGLWGTEETKRAIIKLIEEIDLPMVIDADAIRAVANRKNILKRKKAVLTPHDNEFLALSGIKVSRTNLKERIREVENETKKINSVIVLKGFVDVISDGKKTILNKTGSPFMTKGGCGDTQAGICGALLARKIDTFTAASVAAYINGKAGELAAKEFGEGMLSTDLIRNIPKAIK